jgi:bacteriorhodopsin
MLIESSIISIIIQFIVGIIDIYGLTIPLSSNYKLLKNLLGAELGVQIVEFIFYIWLIFNLNLSNITIYRYIDWFFTTPVMLITLSALLNNKKDISFIDFIKNNSKDVIIIVLLNFLMLLFGYLGEINKLPINISTTIGFIPFVLVFKYIYDRYIKGKSFEKEKVNFKYIYFYFVVIWSLYGVAAYLPFVQKNTMYNILDLFAKNFFGIILFYIIYQYSQL